MPAPTPEQMASWPAPNHINPSTHVTVTLGSLIAGMILAIVFVVARIYTRIKVLKRRIQVDDWIIIAGTVGFLSFPSCFGIL